MPIILKRNRSNGRAGEFEGLIVGLRYRYVGYNVEKTQLMEALGLFHSGLEYKPTVDFR